MNAAKGPARKGATIKIIMRSPNTRVEHIDDGTGTSSPIVVVFAVEAEARVDAIEPPAQSRRAGRR